MLIATFGPSTAWHGKTITLDDGRFILEDHGPVEAADVMDYDRLGHLIWASEGTRAWVGSKALGAPSGARGALAMRRSQDAAGPADAGSAENATPAPESERTIRLKRVLLVVMGVLGVANVALLLMFLGVIPKP